MTGLADLTMNDTSTETLNVRGINCLRTFSVYGNVVWGARTLAGDDLYQSQFKYGTICDATTTSDADRQAGIANLQVGFAPVDPAEFVVLTITLKAGTPTTT